MNKLAKAKSDDEWTGYMKIIFQQSTFDAIQKSWVFIRGAECPVLKSTAKSNSLNAVTKKDDKFLYFQKKVIEHLAGLEAEESHAVNKSFFYMVDTIVKSKFPVGTIREWKGKKYIKIAPGKWRPKYDSNSRGAKLAVAALKRKAENCKTSQELLQLVLENRDRFSDKDGKPLAFVKELSDYVSQKNDALEVPKVAKVTPKNPKAEKKTATKTEKEVKNNLWEEFDRLANNPKYDQHSIHQVAEVIKKENPNLYKEMLDVWGEEFLISGMADVAVERIMSKGKKKGGNGGDEPPKKLSYTGKLRNQLKDNLKSYFGLHTNIKTGIKANLSGDSVNKIGSEKAIEKSKANGFSVEEHFEVANKIVELYESAELTETRPDKKGSKGIISIKCFDSEVELKDGKKALAHITVKESVQNGHKIYSVEVMTLKKITANTRSAVGGKVSKETQTSGSIVAHNNTVVNEKTRKFNTIDEVKAFYKDRQEWLKAPNGKSTKLTEKQWCQVRTENFKNWFGDWENDPKNASKIVDENGEPMVVYHYTNHKFSSFDKDKARGGKHGEGFYFSPEKLTQYGRYKMVCFLNIRNIPEEKESDWTFENWHIYGARSIVEKFGTKKDIEEFKNISNKLDELFRNGKLDDMEPLYKEEMRLTDKILHKNNYDGMIADKLAREIIALEPNQIKSATDNNGDFNPNETSIKKSYSAMVNELKKSFFERFEEG